MSIVRTTSEPQHSRNVSMEPSHSHLDLAACSLHVTGNCRVSVHLHASQKLWKRQLVTLGREATFVETWHVQFQTTHQNRCLHGFGECRGALIPHLVVVEKEELQGGVRLVVLRSSNHKTQQTAERMLSLNVAPAWSKFHSQRMPCENSHNSSATTRPVCCTTTRLLNLQSNDAALNVW